MLAVRVGGGNSVFSAEQNVIDAGVQHDWFEIWTVGVSRRCCLVVSWKVLSRHGRSKSGWYCYLHVLWVGGCCLHSCAVRSELYGVEFGLPTEVDISLWLLH
jgi:hypothetical protein